MAAHITVALRILVDFLRRRGIYSVTTSDCKTAAFPPIKAHVTLPHSVTRDKKILFIGDVHGCLEELEELLTKCHYTDDGMVVIFVGDIISKGPKSAKVVQLARRMEAYSVRGNHEQSILRELFAFHNNEPIREKYRWILDLSKDDENYLQSLPFTLRVESLNVTVVHAGLAPGVELAEQNPRDMMTMRNYVPEECQSTNKITEGSPWAAFWQGPSHVIYGHDARRQLQQYQHATGLDTGCVYGGRLTGLLVEDSDWDRQTLVQVKARQQYAPTSS